MPRTRGHSSYSCVGRTRIRRPTKNNADLHRAHGKYFAVSALLKLLGTNGRHFGMCGDFKLQSIRHQYFVFLFQIYARLFPIRQR